MDAEQLTPYLRRRVMRLSVADRTVLAGEIAQSLQSPEVTSAEQRIRALATVLNGLTGKDVLEKTRRAEIVEARMVLCYVCRMEGFSQHAIGEVLGLDHSTIHYLEKKMLVAFEYPRQYEGAVTLYNKLTNAIL